MKKPERSKLVLLDAHALLHRAYHALPDFTSSTGEPTGALYGLSTFLIKLIRDMKPDYIVACYDLPGPTFRHEAYEEYKGTRAKTDDALVAQLVSSRKVFEAFGIPIYDAPGFEADDVIGTIVNSQQSMVNGHRLQIIIASGDMDTMQLVMDDDVVVYTLKKGMSDTAVYDEAAVIERFGFSPRLLVDYKGLRGDPSDNIVGIAGIGEKTATELIQKFGSIEDIYRVLKKDRSAFIKASIKERVVKLIEDGEEEALFSKSLASIRRDAPIKFSLEETPWKEKFDTRDVARLFGELGFKSLVGRLGDLLRFDLNTTRDQISTEEVSPELAITQWVLDSGKTDPDADAITGTREELEKKIAETGGLEYVYRNIELPLVPILAAAERRGILVDKKYLGELSEKYHAELAQIEGKIREYAGGDFNINSPKQLGEVLFVKLGLTVKGMKKTAGGAPSTRESELEKLKGLHPIVEAILAQRELQKLLSTYIDVLPTLADEAGRIHTHFVQTGTATGRMSSRDPNMQNIPMKTEQGRQIRKAFIATPGFVFLDLDYSQIELRVLAMLSRDEILSEVFKNGGDIHQEVAERVFGVAHDEVTKEMRRRAKVINFGIIYGMGVNALKQNLGTSREEAQKFYDGYFEKFPHIQEWMEETRKFARDNGFTETMYGRRRYFPNIASSSAGAQFMRAAEERMAVNAPVQGTAADIMKIAMIRVDNMLRAAGLEGKVHMLLQVHDELLFEVEKNSVEAVTPLIKECMEGVMTTGKVVSDIPLVVNASVGNNWGELK